MARKFLFLVAGLIVLAVAVAFAYRLFGEQLIRTALVPTTEFVALPETQTSAYADAAMWLSRPDLPPNDPSRWTPEGLTPGVQPAAAVFFIHPTSFLERGSWNAPLDNQEANERAALFLRGQASAFNDTGEIWAPRYRQATFGAFLTTKTEAQKALDLAYRDVLAAFDHFASAVDPKRPIILAGHSQGALHLTRLMRDRVLMKPIAKRIVAAYVVGWPVSRSTDLAALGLPECADPDQARCVLGWQSFAEPADTDLIVDTFDATTGFNGEPRLGTEMVCTNPITGMPGDAAADANLGTLFPSEDLTSARLEPARVAARCEGRGFLLIGEPPSVGPYVLPGNNYHVYDYSLFWANVRADAARRLAAWQGARLPPGNAQARPSLTNGARAANSRG